MIDMITESELRFIKDKVELILAIETIEYHNTNYLVGNFKSRSEVKRSLLLEIVALLGTTAHDKIG